MRGGLRRRGGRDAAHVCGSRGEELSMNDETSSSPPRRSCGGARGADAQHPGGGRGAPDGRHAGQPGRAAGWAWRARRRRTSSRRKLAIDGGAGAGAAVPRGAAGADQAGAVASCRWLFARETRRQPAAAGAEPSPGRGPEPRRPSAPRRGRRSGRRRRVTEAVGIFGGSGFYRFLDDGRGGGGRHARTGRPRRASGSARSRARGWPSCPATATSTRCRRTGSTTAPTSGR